MVLITFALLLQQPPTQNFAPVARPGADPLLAADVRAICPASASGDANALLKLEESEARVAVRTGATADSWLTLACTRAHLAVLGTLSRESTLMISGDSWAQGAIKAFSRVLALRPDDRRAADGLSVLSLNENTPRDVPALAESVTRAARAGTAGAPALRACADLDLRVGRADDSHFCATKGLATGRDSTWHLLILSRLAFRRGDSVTGARDFIAAADAAHDTTARLDVAWNLQWFLSPEEYTQWTKLSDGSRGAWIRDHLATRDVRDGRPAGARIAEHFKRLEYVDSAFKLNVPRMLKTAMLTKPSVGMTGTSQAFAPPGTAQEQSEATTMLLNTAFRDYQRWQVDWDDRGVIWMRYGVPTLTTVGWVGVQPLEIWRYDIDGKELLFSFQGEDFDGSAGATRLVVGRINKWYCGIDQWRCQLSMRPRLDPETVAMVRQQDHEYISAGTTADDNSVRTDRQITLASRLHRLWDPVTGAPIGLLTFAVKASDLVVQKEDGATTARVHFDFRRWDAATEKWQDTSFSRRFTTTLAGAKELTGFVVTPSSPSVSSWSLVATQSDVRRGRAWDVASPPLGTGPLALSDLVLGQEGQGLTWVNHNADILLAPLNGVDRKLPVSLYYQIRSETDRRSVKSSVALYRVDGGVARDTAALQVGFEQQLQRGINEAAPMLDISRLDRASYRLEVALFDEQGKALIRRTVLLNIE